MQAAGAGLRVLRPAVLLAQPGLDFRDAVAVHAGGADVWQAAALLELDPAVVTLRCSARRCLVTQGSGAGSSSLCVSGGFIGCACWDRWRRRAYRAFVRRLGWGKGGVARRGAWPPSIRPDHAQDLKSPSEEDHAQRECCRFFGHLHKKKVRNRGLVVQALRRNPSYESLASQDAVRVKGHQFIDGTGQN